MPSIRIHPEVVDALAANAPVVALESAVITAGLSREPLANSSRLMVSGWDRSQPIHLELSRQMQHRVRANGAIPATVAVIQGDLCIGLNDDELVMLAEEKCAAKASVTDLAHIMATGGFAGTTVSATLTACGFTHTIDGTRAESPLRVFATGGIGGVHRHWQNLPDISADLHQIAKSPIAVVCSGAKSILDLPATLEMLETLGVPVFGFRTDHFPQFLSRGDEHLRITHRIDDVKQMAEICRHHWETLRSATGILVTNPVPAEFAMPHRELDETIEAIERDAVRQRIAGAARTPFLLAELAQRTNGRSLDANIALLLNNAALAAQLSVALSA